PRFFCPPDRKEHTFLADSSSAARDLSGRRVLPDRSDRYRPRAKLTMPSESMLPRPCRPRALPGRGLACSRSMSRSYRNRSHRRPPIPRLPRVWKRLLCSWRASARLEPLLLRARQASLLAPMPPKGLERFRRALTKQPCRSGLAYRKGDWPPESLPTPAPE